MVISGEGRERGEEESMAMGPERSKRLHNFSLPCLRWGNQKFLRCVKVNSNGELGAIARRSSAPETERGFSGRRRDSEGENRGSIDLVECLNRSPSPATVLGAYGKKLKTGSDVDDGIEAVREKLMFDLQTAADKMKVAILREGLEEEQPATAVPSAEREAVRPWNLRTRRAACKAPNGTVGGAGGNSNAGGCKNLKIDERKTNFSPLRTENRSPTSKGVPATEVSTGSGEMKERAKFSVSLSRREVEEDFMAILGQRPPRRPKKRAKIVQRQLDSLFPGLWLTEVSADTYKVPDAPETGKR